ncbi:MAG: BolA family protein [Ghiorsea sp.]
MSSVNPETLKSLVCSNIIDAEVDVHCYSGDDHFEMTVISALFEGKSRINRHKMVYAALGDNMRQAVHALALKTHTPQEALS